MIEEIEKPNNDFFTRETVDELLAEAGTGFAFSFTSLLGDTITEKYESIFVKIVEVTNVLVAKGAKGYFWIVGSPEFVSIFETSSGFDHLTVGEFNQIPLGIDVIEYRGIASRKWRVYADSQIPADTFLIGAGYSKKPRYYYAKGIMHDFVI